MQQVTVTLRACRTSSFSDKLDNPFLVTMEAPDWFISGVHREYCGSKDEAYQAVSRLESDLLERSFVKSVGYLRRSGIQRLSSSQLVDENRMVKVQVIVKFVDELRQDVVSLLGPIGTPPNSVVISGIDENKLSRMKKVLLKEVEVHSPDGAILVLGDFSCWDTSLQSGRAHLSFTLFGDTDKTDVKNMLADYLLKTAGLYCG